MQSHINSCYDSFALPPHSPTALLSTHNSPPPPAQLKTEESVACDAFSILMSSRKENNAWKEAEAAEDRGFRPTKATGGRRKAPFYKVLEGMPIAVDAFRYGAIPGVTSYFLTYAYPFTIYALTALMCIFVQARTFRPLHKSVINLAGRSNLLLRYCPNGCSSALSLTTLCRGHCKLDCSYAIGQP
jgi:hypothetical protein